VGEHDGRRVQVNNADDVLSLEEGLGKPSIGLEISRSIFKIENFYLDINFKSKNIIRYKFNLI
jgi:hypothetical protein